ncbi:organic cation/carnitine transporter 2-like [Sardina pilchardus]|uniref:organic cation/carnitine transporter 2-like n=1 Tax=Sardina pilchardus TaxID=27697 RepID=UPI002E0FD2EB
MREYDEITSFLGTWGRFQKMVFFSLAVSILPNGFVGIYIVFVADTPPHECLIPEESNISESWRNVSIPLVEQDGQVKRSSCSRYSLEHLRNFSLLNYVPDVDVNVSQIQQESCLDGWKYSKEIYQSTIVTEWDLVCDNEYKVPLTSSLYFGGALVGTFLSGLMSDRLGRRPMLFVMMVVQTVTTFAQIFSNSWEMFAAVYCLFGFGNIANYLIAYVLGCETLGPAERVVFSSMGVFMSSALGSIAMPAAAFLLRQWQWLVGAMVASGLLYVPLWWLIPESPRWLLSQGRVEEAEAILRNAARMNKVTVPQVIFTPDEIENFLGNKEKTYSILDVLRSISVSSVVGICSLLWMVIILGYSCLILNTSNLSGSPYLNAFLSAAVEAPAYVIALLLLKFCSRHVCQSSTLLLGGTVILFIRFIPADFPGLAIAFEMLGKFGITAAFCVVYSVTSELFPTVVRNTAMGICSMAARVASILSPFIIYLGKSHKFLPYIIMGSLAIFGGLLCLLLPETYGKVLPETITEMQTMKGLKRNKAPNPDIGHRQYVQKEAKF